jgi:hypothetical protein
MGTDVLAFLTQAWNTFTKGRSTSGLVILAQRDIFDAYLDSVLALERSGDGPDVSIKALAFKTATMYKLDAPGWRVRFMAYSTQEFNGE